MPVTSTAPSSPPDALDAIVAALTGGGPRTAGQLAEQMNIAYSTLTPRLRALEDHGRVERIKDPTTRQIIWQATATTPAGDIATDDKQHAASDAADIGDSDALSDAGTVTSDTDAAADGDAHDDAAVTTTADGDVATDGDSPAEVPADQAAQATAGTDAADGQTQTSRRRKGAIPAAILEVTRAHPDDTFKVSQLQKALDGVSAGAIANAAAKLVVAGELHCVCEKPATYQAA